MVKAKTMKKNVRKAPMKNQKRQKQVQFSNVSRIDTAPVAIGNSIRGSKPVITNSADGCRVVGRDFVFESKATIAAINNWSLIGGMPVTPSVLATSSLRSYAQLFSKYKINRLAFHYVTSSPTTQSGDILFYYEHDRNGPMIDYTNNSFLPFVLSDANTVLGPQWQNHTAIVKPVMDWNTTDYGMSTDLNEESDGSMFLFSKTSSANSPGYVLVDFDITFKEMCVNPRAGILPITRGLWNYLTVGGTLLVVTTASSFSPTIQGNNQDGTASAVPNGALPGDIYKVVFAVTNSTLSNVAWTNVTPANLVDYSINGSQVSTTIDDGFTCYGLLNAASTSMTFYPTLEGAKTATSQFRYGVAATISFNLNLMISYVGNVNVNSQSSY